MPWDRGVAAGAFGRHVSGQPTSRPPTGSTLLRMALPGTTTPCNVPDDETTAFDRSNRPVARVCEAHRRLAPSMSGTIGGPKQAARDGLEPSALILTVDHEVFGDGSGSLEACMISPLERLLGVVERHHAPLTIFLEPLHLMAAQDHGRGGAVEAVLAQVRQAAARGHEVQLHLHPQWWPVVAGQRKTPDPALWRIGGLDEATLELMIRRGLDWLRHGLGDEAVRTVNVFRAGGWCIQPEANVLRALAACGFKADSTVAPGVWNPIGVNWHDFRNVPTLPYWRVGNRLDVLSSDGVLEIPICTGKVARLRNIGSHLRKRLTSASGLPEGCSGTYRGAGGRLARIRQRLWRARTSGLAMLDFSSLPAGMMADLVQRHVALHAVAGAVIPVVAIGHSKNFDRRAAYELDAFLDWSQTRNVLRPTTYTAWLNASAPV